MTTTCVWICRFYHINSEELQQSTHADDEQHTILLLQHQPHTPSLDNSYDLVNNKNYVDISLIVVTIGCYIYIYIHMQITRTRHVWRHCSSSNK